MKNIIILIILILCVSCSTLEFTKWEDMTQQDKIITVAVGIAGIIHTAGMSYWIANPNEVPDNWPIDQ